MSFLSPKALYQDFLGRLGLGAGWRVSCGSDGLCVHRQVRKGCRPRKTLCGLSRSAASDVPCEVPEIACGSRGST